VGMWLDAGLLARGRPLGPCVESRIWSEGRGRLSFGGR
jgi:hypothetical protein